MGIPAAAENPQFQSGAGSGPSPGFALQAKHCNAYFCLQENSKADSFSHPHSPRKSQKTGHVRKGKVPSRRTFSPNCKTATSQTGFKALLPPQTRWADWRWGLVKGHGARLWDTGHGYWRWAMVMGLASEQPSSPTAREPPPGLFRRSEPTRKARSGYGHTHACM